MLAAQLQRTTQWFEDRKNRLTASQFGAALGLSPYLSRVALWKQLTGRSESFTGNVATDWGQEHEKDAIHAYEVATGNLVEPSGFVPWDTWSGCSPDGWVSDGGSRGILEAKAPYSQRIYEDIPDHYRAQVIGQLAITGAAWADFIVWVPDGHRIWRVDPQPATWDRMQVALKEFWQHVLNDKEPPRARRFQLKE